MELFPIPSMVWKTPLRTLQCVSICSQMWNLAWLHFSSGSLITLVCFTTTHGPAPCPRLSQVTVQLAVPTAMLNRTVRVQLASPNRIAAGVGWARIVWTAVAVPQGLTTSVPWKSGNSNNANFSHWRQKEHWTNSFLISTTNYLIFLITFLSITN